MARHKGLVIKGGMGGKKHKGGKKKHKGGKKRARRKR